MYRICMVCTGNICRSPMAASILLGKLAEAGLGAAVSVSSAGTYDLHAGSPMDPRAESTLIAHGYPVGHVARKFQAGEFGEHNLILVTDRWNVEFLEKLAAEHSAPADIRLIRSFDRTLDEPRDVPDPFNGTQSNFEAVREQLERACDGLIAHLRATLPDAPAPGR
ncbi:MAG: low molecular weight protein-tyrosine-phosphatase [Sporichthyaceae bacterium]